MNPQNNNNFMNLNINNNNADDMNNKNNNINNNVGNNYPMNMNGQMNTDMNNMMNQMNNMNINQSNYNMGFNGNNNINNNIGFNLNNNINNNMCSNSNNSNIGPNINNNINNNNIKPNMNNNINNMSYNLNGAQNMNTNNNMTNNVQNNFYAKIIIQSFNLLNAFKSKLFGDDNFNNMQFKNFTNTFKLLFSAMFDNMNEKYFGDIMQIYTNKMNNSIIPHPYHFLKRILKILKEENQKTILSQQQKNQLLETWKNKRFNFEASFNLFKNNVIEYDKSFVCDSLYYSSIENISCNFCNNYYKFSLLPMIEINLDNFTPIGSPKYNLSKYLETYFNNEFGTICSICGNQAKIKSKIINNSPILIIHIYRNDINGNNTSEINVDINLNITNCIHPPMVENLHKEYILKGYISYDEGNGYFMDYNFKVGKNDFMWFRYSKGIYTQINNDCLNNCKPILIFYEAKDVKKPKQNKPPQNTINANPQNRMIPNQQFQNPGMGSPGIMNMSINPNMVVNNHLPQTNLHNSFNPLGVLQITQPMMQPNMQQFNQQQMNLNLQAKIQLQMSTMNQQNLLNNMNQILNNVNVNNQGNNPSNQNENKPKLNNENEDENNLKIIFFLVTDSNPDDESQKLDMYVKKDETVKELYKKYLTKLSKTDENYIKKLVLNGNEISKTSTQKLSEIPITNNCKIKAFKNEAI